MLGHSSMLFRKKKKAKQKVCIFGYYFVMSGITFGRDSAALEFNLKYPHYLTFTILTPMTILIELSKLTYKKQTPCPSGQNLHQVQLLQM